MSYAAVAVSVIAAGIAAGGLSWQIRRAFRLDTLRRHHEIGSAVFLQLGVVFAVLLAFVFNEVWGEYNTAADAINMECGNLRGAAVVASTLPSPGGPEIEQAIIAYLRAVIASEWPAMIERRPSPEAASRFTRLVTMVVVPSPAEAGREAARNQVISLVGQAYIQRQTRLFEVTQGVPPLLWFLLVSFAVTLVGFLLCFGVEYIWSQVIFTGTFAAAIAFVLLLVHLLDYPFEGALRLSPQDFIATLEDISLLAQGNPG